MNLIMITITILQTDENESITDGQMEDDDEDAEDFLQDDEEESIDEEEEDLESEPKKQCDQSNFFIIFDQI